MAVPILRTLVRSLYLVRHAVAEERGEWSGPELRRPLNQAGWRQALSLVELLAEAGIEAHYSSPAVRCRDTLLPLAHAHGLPVQDDSRLLEGGPPLDPEDARRELARLLAVYFADGAQRVAACSHGDILPPLLQAGGAGAGSRSPKGGVWRLDIPDDKERVTQAVYLGRPDAGGRWEQR